MWGLPGPGIERISSALVGVFLTTAIPGKSNTLKILGLETKLPQKWLDFPLYFFHISIFIQKYLCWAEEEYEKVGLKLNIHKTKIMASYPIISWQIDGETMATVRDFILGGSKITADGDCSHEIKICLFLGRKVMTNLESILKSRDITLPTKIHLVKVMVSPVVIYGCESWTIKKAEHWRTDAFLWYIYTMEYYSAIKNNAFELVLMRWMKLEPIIHSEVSQKEKHQHSILTHIYIEFRKIVMMTLSVRQQKRPRCKEQTFGLCGRRQGWDDLRE